MESNYRILLVDDEKMNLDMMATVLRGIFKIKIVKCDNGAEALELYKKDPFPIVFTDTKMEGLSGLDLLKKIKEMHVGSKTKVILFSGFFGKPIDRIAIEFGAYEFLYKPVDIGIIIEIIQQDIKERFGGRTDLNVD